MLWSVDIIRRMVGYLYSEMVIWEHMPPSGQYRNRANTGIIQKNDSIERMNDFTN